MLTAKHKVKKKISWEEDFFGVVRLRLINDASYIPRHRGTGLHFITKGSCMERLGGVLPVECQQVSHVRA